MEVLEGSFRSGRGGRVIEGEVNVDDIAVEMWGINVYKHVLVGAA